MATPQSTNDFSTMNGMFKDVYAKEIKNLVPDGVKLLNMIPFNKSERLGKSFNQPVVLRMEQGLTFAEADAGVVTLNDAIASVSENAEVKGYQVILRAALAYDALFRSKDDKTSFISGTKHIVQSMIRSITKVSEIMMLYGQVGLGTVSSYDSGDYVVTVTTADWASGIWAGGEGMPIEIRSAAGVLRGNANLANVDFSGRTLTLDQGIAGVVSTDVLYRKGTYGKEFAGIHKTLTNTGVLHGIDAAEYSLWKGNSYSAGAAALSFNKLQDAIALAVEKGFEGKCTVVVNPKTWTDLLNEQAALRMYDQSYSKVQLENGAEAIRFHSQSGVVEIMTSIYCKEGYAYCLDIQSWSRIGSTDYTFMDNANNGDAGESYFKDVPNSTAVELRLYQCYSAFCVSPCSNTLISGIVN